MGGRGTNLDLRGTAARTASRSAVPDAIPTQRPASRRMRSPLIRFPGSLALGAVLAACLQTAPSPASAGRICDRIPQSPPSYASRVALAACAENTLWYGPFIDSQGRLASVTVSENERLRLQDGTTPAWQRVVEYWQGSGLLEQMSHFPGAADCSRGDGGHLLSASCRAFLSDTPWSAAFVSFVMARAGLPGFTASASHIEFAREAHRSPGASPYVLGDPVTGVPAAGDLLCYSRARDALGAQGFREMLDSGSTDGLNMHCDIVVAASPGGDGKLYLVGGNVLQGVTMRVLPLDRTGRIRALPRRTGAADDCHPGNEAMCSFNRQDWVALLRLKPLPAPAGPLPLPDVRLQQCCTRCPLPMPPYLRRCPLPQRPVDAEQPQADAP